MPAWLLCISSIYCVITVGKHLYASLPPVYLICALMSSLEVSICMPAWPLCSSSIYCSVTVGKHLYASLAPVYLICVLCHYCR